MNDKTDSQPEKVETVSKLAYTTESGKPEPKKVSRVAALTDTADPALKPTKRIAKKSVKKPSFSRVSQRAQPLTHIKVRDDVLKAAKKIIASKDNTYSRFDIVDDETVVVR